MSRLTPPPGPWWVEDRRSSGGALQVQAQHRGAGSSYCIASVNVYEAPVECACLIAAAPNLLETLRMARERIAEDRDVVFRSVVAGDPDDGAGLEDIPNGDDRAEVERYDALLRVIDGDIAKAEGKS